MLVIQEQEREEDDTEEDEDDDEVGTSGAEEVRQNSDPRHGAVPYLRSTAIQSLVRCALLTFRRSV